MKKPVLEPASREAVLVYQSAPFVVPEAPWRNIRGMGNWLRHQYDSVDLEMIWETMRIDLPALKEAVLLALNA